MTTHSFENVDQLLDVVKTYGRYQRIVNIMLFIMKATSYPHVVMMYFIAAPPKWKCRTNSSVCTFNGTFPITNKAACELPKTEWEYIEPSSFSIISHFGINCNRSWMIHLATSSLFLGWAVGALILSYLADNYGRRRVVFLSTFLLALVGLISAYVPNIELYILCRFIIGVSYPGCGHITIILMAEIVGEEHRPLTVASLHLADVVGGMLLGVVAYFIRDWRYLLLASTIPSIVTMAFYPFIQESIRFLHARHLSNQLTRVVKKMSHWNKSAIPEDFMIVQNPLQVSSGKTNPLHLFRTLSSTIKTLTLIYSYFAVSLAYYGLNIVSDDLGNSFYGNFIVMHAIEIPADILFIFWCKWSGRKTITPTTMIFGNICCIAIAFIPQVGKMKVSRIIIGTLGKACIALAFTGLYLWAAELYDTKERANALGVFQLGGKVGGASSSWVGKALKQINPMLPFITMGTVGLVAGCLMYILPETKGRPTDVSGNNNAVNDIVTEGVDDNPHIGNMEEGEITQMSTNVCGEREMTEGVS